MELYIHAFFTFEINVDKWLASCSIHPKEQTPQHSLNKRLGALRAGLVALEKIKICLSLPQIKP
jgi:hypothetical protein